jgi:hypothetical protein
MSDEATDMHFKPFCECIDLQLIKTTVACCEKDDFFARKARLLDLSPEQRCWAKQKHPGRQY